MKLFTEHPHSMGETYGQHGLRAIRYSYKLFKAACACFWHGCFPFLLQTYTSDTIKEILDSISKRQMKKAA